MSSRPTWFRRVLMAALGVGLLLPLCAAAAAPQPQARTVASKDLVTFGLGPSDGKGVDGRPYFYYAAAGGAVVKDHVVVLNYSRHALHLSLYATDGFNSPTGANSLLAAGQTPHDLGAWTRLGVTAGTILVPGRASELDPPGARVFPFTVTVPRGASPGDHVGGLVVSLRTYARNSQGFVIPLDQRVATQVFLRVAGTLHPRLRVEHLTAHYVGTWNPLGTGRVHLTYTVHNVGNVRLGGAQHVAVSGLFGSWGGPHLPDLPLLVPGGSAQVETTVHGVWPEIWMPGDVRVTALKLQTDVNPATPAASASKHFWAIPWTLLLLIAAAFLSWRLRKALRRRPDPAQGGSGKGGTPPPSTDPTGPTRLAVVPVADVEAPEPSSALALEAPTPVSPATTLPLPAAPPYVPPTPEPEPLIWQELMGSAPSPPVLHDAQEPTP